MALYCSHGYIGRVGHREVLISSQVANASYAVGGEAYNKVDAAVGKGVGFRGMGRQNGEQAGE